MKIKQKEFNQRGFSEPILQPCYLIGTSIIFLLTPMLGLFISFMVVFIPAMALAAYIANKQPVVKYDTAGYLKALDRAIEKKTKQPLYADYKIEIVKQPKRIEQVKSKPTAPRLSQLVVTV